ncbi:cyclophilin-like domain-containing protein [Ochromonadaceae sp. CCMP2298]|nr:cyclophilin-like domain-containing protein [Ochromonadaceae sp. CCMP2298]|eukprot:CAMPEP_0173336426 /NCGR_PEP_ID=MMETSP1144-20121109/6536_1 /TAXON_ID=483371 /ORGANISM="non described non described, Strain CCMP2298" /LENGTH=279 /DNA_ID=CAMNT_0014281689 /DNA_START=40 /DNA_END=879 /DNA_ORIENTATION=+
MQFLVSLLLSSAVASSLSQELPRVQCTTTKGPLTIEIHRDWAPLGADRFVELVKDNFFTDIAFFRCVKGFLTQFGISDKPDKKHWHRATIPDDPNLGLGIKKQYVSFAGGGANTRSTQMFIAFEDLDFLGKEPWETPFGVVVEGAGTLKKLYKSYGDIPPFGNGPDQQEIHLQGNAYIRTLFPQTDFLIECAMVSEQQGVLDDEVNPHKGEIEEGLAMGLEEHGQEPADAAAAGADADAGAEAEAEAGAGAEVEQEQGKSEEKRKEVQGGECAGAQCDL